MSHIMKKLIAVSLLLMMLMPAAKEIAGGQVSFLPQTANNAAGSNKIVFAHDYYESIIQTAETVTHLPLLFENSCKKQERLTDSGKAGFTVFYGAVFFNEKPTWQFGLKTGYSEFYFNESILTDISRDNIFIISSMLSYIGLLRLFDGEANTIINSSSLKTSVR